MENDITFIVKDKTLTLICRNKKTIQVPIKIEDQTLYIKELASDFQEVICYWSEFLFFCKKSGINRLVRTYKTTDTYDESLEQTLKKIGFSELEYDSSYYILDKIRFVSFMNKCPNISTNKIVKIHALSTFKNDNATLNEILIFLRKQFEGCKLTYLKDSFFKYSMFATIAGAVVGVILVDFDKDSINIPFIASSNDTQARRHFVGYILYKKLVKRIELDSQILNLKASVDKQDHISRTLSKPINASAISGVDIFYSQYCLS